jgi:DNA-directed RNA polymerase II subunit RPB11
MSKLTYRNDVEPHTLINQPDDVKLTREPFRQNLNADDFTLTKEDHTVANLLRMKLHTNPQVKFAGYKVPHPTLHTVILRIQTMDPKDGGKAAAGGTLQTPSEALDQALRECIADLDEFDRQLTALVESQQ